VADLGAAIEASGTDAFGRSDAIASWIEDQIAMPPTLHRVFYRRRVDPRPVAGGSVLGVVGSPCASGSRWHRWAFTLADERAAVDVEVPQPTVANPNPDVARTKLLVDGVVRAIGSSSHY
jgi:hypothetical protein